MTYTCHQDGCPLSGVPVELVIITDTTRVVCGGCQTELHADAPKPKRTKGNA